MGDTTIRISKSTWQELHDRKGPGDSFDGVIQDLIQENKGTAGVADGDDE